MADWYVDPAGNDSNSGTASGPANAFLTLQKAHDAAASNDIIHMAGGTYPPPDPTVDAIPLTITKHSLAWWPDGTGTVVLDGNNTAHSYVLLLSGHTTSLQGILATIEIINCRWRGINEAGGGSGSNFYGLYIHHIGNRSEPSSTPICGFYDGGSDTANTDWMALDSCQFSHIGRTNNPGNCYDAAIVSQGTTSITNSVFCDSFNSWHIRGIAGCALHIQGNWFFGANGFPKPGQIKLEGACGNAENGGITIDSNIFYDPGTVAIASSNTFSCLTLNKTNNQIFTNSGATLSDFTGGVETGNTTGSLASYTGSFPCGSGGGTGGAFSLVYPFGNLGNSAPVAVLDQLAVVQTFGFDEVYINQSIGGGPSGTWGPSKVIINGHPGPFFSALSYGSGAANLGDTELGSLVADSNTAFLYYYPWPPGTPKEQVDPSGNVNTAVEGFPIVNQYNYDSSQGVWEYEGYLWVLAGLDKAHGGGSQRVGMFGRLASGGPWLEYDAANCPGTVPYSWYDGGLQPAARRTKDRRYVDVCFNVGDYNANSALTHIALDTFDFHTKTWTGAYGDIDLAPVNYAVDFKPGNSIMRYSNNVLGVWYVRPPAGFGGTSTVIYREYTPGVGWGSEITILASTNAPWQGNFAPDYANDQMYNFVYTDTFHTGLNPAAYLTQQGGTITAIFTFPNYATTDGTNNPIVHAGNVYLPYDEWPSKTNRVWVMPVGGSTFTPQDIPVPFGEEGANPSCAFMVLTASVGGSYAYVRNSARAFV